METFKGISASGGTGAGPAFVVPEPETRAVPQYAVAENDCAAEWQRFETALQTVHTKIEAMLPGADGTQTEIFQTYLLMLSDAEFLKQVRTEFERARYNIEYILDRKVTEMAAMLRSSNDAYLSERAADICDVFGRVSDELLGYKPFDFETVPDGAVIVARAVNPSDAVVLSRRNIKGLVITEGGTSSHLAILARNYQVPAVFGIQHLSALITTGRQVLVDGTAGTVTVDPDAATLERFNSAARAESVHRAKLAQYRFRRAVTEDGTELQLYANIGLPEEAQIALDEGADGIGLFRTEFLFMGAVQSAKKQGASGVHSVSEEAQFNAYKQVLETMGDKPVTIRTLDAGGDKLIKSAGIPVSEEKNPLLGSRAIRLTLAHPALFKRQLRALYRASAFGNLKIMLPLVTHPAQVKETLALIADVKAELAAEGHAFAADTPVGIMVETAAAAVTADIFAEQCRFFSIGTNDLTQYTLGIDRENSAVAPLYDERNIAVLRLIKHTVDSAAKAGIPVSVCGEMAGDPEGALLLAGMGVRSLSMAPVRITALKELFASHSMTELQKKAAAAFLP